MTDFVLLDARPGGAWAQGHFQGALDADLDRYLSTACDDGFDPARGGRHPLPPLERWCRQLGLWGIDPGTRVLVYDGQKGEMGACRLWWMLTAVGHRNVDVLDGGIAAGRTHGWPWTTEPSPLPPPLPPYPARAWTKPVIDREEVDRWRTDPSHVVLDVRSPERWRGETEPLDPVAGRIPGSLNIPLASLWDADGRFRSDTDLREVFAPVLARPATHVAVHCGSGVSACAALYAWERIGFDGASLYVGSYSQWCRSDRPIGKGLP